MSETSVVLPAPVDPTIATVSPRFGLEADALQHRRLGAGVGELDLVERDRARARRTSLTGFSARVRVDSLASTSPMRSAETAARGIMIVMKLAISTPIRI